MTQFFWSRRTKTQRVTEEGAGPMVRIWEKMAGERRNLGMKTANCRSHVVCGTLSRHYRLRDRRNRQTDASQACQPPLPLRQLLLI